MNPKIKIVCFGRAGENVLGEACNLVRRAELNDIEVECCWYTKETEPEDILYDGPCDLLLLVAGLGRNDAFSAVMEVGLAARERRIPVGAFVTRPFRFEGSGVGREADCAVQELKNVVDFYHVFACDDVLELPQFADKNKSTIEQAFKAVDRCFAHRIMNFVETFGNRGQVCADFFDVLAVLRKCGTGTEIINVEAVASGVNRIEDALAQIRSSLPAGIHSKGLIILVSHDELFSLADYSAIIEGVYEELCENPEEMDNIIIADSITRSNDQEIRVNVWCTLL